MGQIQTVSIIGVGQIGTSIAAALTTNSPALKINMYDVDRAQADLLKTRFQELGLTSDHISFSDNAAQAAAEGDIVILATPISTFGSVVTEIKDALKPGSILTDIGSAKEMAIANITAALGVSPVPYIPAHNGNGSQGSGPLTGSPGNILGANSWMFIIDRPQETAAEQAAKTRLIDFWKSAGVQVTTTDAATHDRFFGTCSHFQHLVAFRLLDMSGIDEQTNIPGTYSHSGTAFRNLTRVAISTKKAGQPSPLVKMWEPILQQNGAKVCLAMDGFIGHLDRLSGLAKAGDKDGLLALLTEAHEFRKSIKDLEPRESISGEFSDQADYVVAACLDDEPIMAQVEKYTNETQLLTFAIAVAQTLNARDGDENLVRDKANPSFRDGTAACLYDPSHMCKVLLGNAPELERQCSELKAGLQASRTAIEQGNKESLESLIERARSARTHIPGPRKGRDVRPEFMINGAQFAA